MAFSFKNPNRNIFIVHSQKSGMMKKRAGKANSRSFIGNSKSAIFALLIIAAGVTAYGIVNAATVSHTPQQIQPQGAGSTLDSDKLEGVSLAEILAAGGGGPAVACELICNGGCPSAPAGWTLTSSSGYSGGTTAVYGGGGSSAGRCAKISPDMSPSYVVAGTETMCCYFKD